MKLQSHLPACIAASLSTRSTCTKADLLSHLLSSSQRSVLCMYYTDEKIATFFYNAWDLLCKGHLKIFTRQIYTHPESLVVTKSWSEENDCQENCLDNKHRLNCFWLLRDTQLMDYKESNSLLLLLTTYYVYTHFFISIKFFPKDDWDLLSPKLKSMTSDMYFLGKPTCCNENFKSINFSNI